MTHAVEQVLESFDQLDEVEHTRAAAAILHKTLMKDLPPLTEDELTAAADELFVQLDQNEERNAAY